MRPLTHTHAHTQSSFYLKSTSLNLKRVQTLLIYIPDSGLVLFHSPF